MKTKLELYNAIKEYAVNIGYTSIDIGYAYKLYYDGLFIAYFRESTDYIIMYSTIITTYEDISTVYSKNYYILKEYEYVIGELFKFTVAYKKAQKELLIREIENE